MADSEQKVIRDWYSISVTSLRRGMTLIGLVVTLIGSTLIYQQWEQSTRRDRAEAAIEDARDLARSLEDREDYDQIRIEHHIAWEDLKDAQAEFDGGRYGPALIRARAAIRELDPVFDLGPNNAQR